MKKGFIHILFSLVLSLAVTDFIWIELIQDENVVAEIETSEQKEELKEAESFESKDDSDGNSDTLVPGIYAFTNTAAGFIKHGKSYLPYDHSKSPKRYILFHQLKLHC